jgi:glycosyltransferase involved in cell wall biosynthesis
MKVYLPVSYKLHEVWRGGYNLLKGVANALKPHAQVEWLCLYSEENLHEELKALSPSHFFADPEKAEAFLQGRQQNDPALVFSLGYTNLWACDIPRVVYIPDFQHEYFPSFFSESERELRRFHYAVEAATASALWFPSQSVASDARRFLPQLPSLQLQQYFPLLRGQAERPALTPEKIILCVSQYWKHKNVERLLEAWELLGARRQDFQLVLVGKGFSALTSSPKPSVKVLDSVSDEDLFALYHRAYAFVLPSLFEGWSTPVEEAIAAGLPLMLSDIAVLKEQAPQGSLFFNPMKASAIAETMAGLIANPSLREKLHQDVLRNTRLTREDFGLRLSAFFKRSLA